MSQRIHVQYAIDRTGLPDEASLLRWAEAALEGRVENAELSLRITDSDEIRALNRDYRGKDKPTNVLSFPMELPPELELNELGDIIICAEVVAREAREQGKTPDAHWAHMVIHGCLHLLGYDHQGEAEADEMEGLETRLLSGLGYSNPY